jgi:hypothetical protein
LCDREEFQQEPDLKLNRQKEEVKENKKVHISGEGILKLIFFSYIVRDFSIIFSSRFYFDETLTFRYILEEGNLQS